jgi:hypothetical protein
MYISTARHDLAGVKHALELGVVLAALVLAVAAHGGTRLPADFTAAPGIAAMPTRVAASQGQAHIREGQVQALRQPYSWLTASGIPNTKRLP